MMRGRDIFVSVARVVVLGRNNVARGLIAGK